MDSLVNHSISLRSPDGVLLAQIEMTPLKDASSAVVAPLVEVDELDAQEHGETTIQLRESERYEYELRPENGADLRLRCSLATRRRSLGTTGKPDAGLIETRTFCGTLLLELVEGEVDNEKPAIASALLDVRSLKLDYRTEYRGMVRRLSGELAGLVADARSSAKLGFQSNFEERTDEGWLQIQLELLRETLDSSEFSAALQRILSFPHERLSAVNDTISTDRPIRWTPAAVRQLVTNNPRRTVPASHPLRAVAGLESMAERVTIPRKSRDLDTPENRFVKFALGEFRAFLAHAQGVFESCAGWGASAALAHRLGVTVDDWLGRGLFSEVGDMRFAPLGSPVLQRKAGYREVLRWWLRFRTAAELSWQGGEDLFRAGQRDVASLYEYWLFFELLDWFCIKCRDGNRPAVEELVDGLEDGSPNLRLRKRLELGPFSGVFSGQSRRLSARFSYNRRFGVSKERRQPGSWTRSLHPDYTFTFWPDGLTEAEAEARELLVHIHFDAKYRVEDIESLFGGSDSDDADEESEGTYKRQDLLKMHAYRDAIKRSQGAYVLYPGGGKPEIMSGFHEILPGLGAFSVCPDENGTAKGMGALDEFLNTVLDHLSNRTTAQERVSFHVEEAYASYGSTVNYGSLKLPETDTHWIEYRAIPPAEETALVAWYETPQQLLLAQDQEGLVYVRLGTRRGAFHVPPKLSTTRHVLMHTHGTTFAPGLLLIREPGYRVLTRSELRKELQKFPKARGIAAWQEKPKDDDDENIYAVFRTTVDPVYQGTRWHASQVMDEIEKFESDRRNKPVENVGRSSAYPRILSLSGVLSAIAGE
jgi:predicted component of viral defense system (DUF524 family)